MKIVTPDYYKNFKCIAGECTDTCCAGWDVDVDKESYKQYRRVIGSFGNKLRSVMVPSEDGGCTFTLKEGRCPFLNKNTLWQESVNSRREASGQESWKRVYREDILNGTAW